MFFFSGEHAFVLPHHDYYILLLLYYTVAGAIPPTIPTCSFPKYIIVLVHSPHFERRGRVPASLGSW